MGMASWPSWRVSRYRCSMTKIKIEANEKLGIRECSYTPLRTLYYITQSTMHTIHAETHFETHSDTHTETPHWNASLKCLTEMPR